MRCSGLPCSFVQVNFYYLLFTFRFSEPTNNIAPKAIDKKIGFTLVSNDVNSTVFLMCPVVAFPVPLIRYLRCFFSM